MRRFLYVLTVLCLSLAAFAQTPPAPPQLTWIRYYQAAPGHEMELTKLLSESSNPVFQKLIDDKKVVGWGIAVPMSHTGEPWTHVAYVGLADWSAVDAMNNAFEALDAKMSAAELKKMDAQFQAAMKPNAMRDVVLRHITQGGPSNMTKPKYIGVETYVIKQGRFGDAVGLFNEWAKPIFTDAAANGGKVGPWGVSMQQLVTMPGWTHMVWFFMNDLTAIDEMGAATRALGPKLKEYDVRLRDLSEPEKHQGQILRIVYQQP